MKTIIVSLAFAAVSLSAHAQDVKELQESARSFMRQGDYSNAILVLNKAQGLAPENLDVSKELALAYYQKSDLPKMQSVLKPLLERKDADAAVYQLSGMLYQATEDDKEAERIYKKGLKAFPNSGVLYSEYGQMLWNKKDYTAIRQWEKGIEVEPNYSGNYYNASRYYYFTLDKVWSIVYGEIFVNLESFSKRTIEVKNLLIDSYKKLYSEADLAKGQDTKNPFVSAWLAAMAKQASVAGNGITAETLTMIRTRFLLDWYEKDAGKFPSRLFDYQRQLIKEGVFDAYNQWLFGSVQNLTAYQNWTSTHGDVYDQFSNAQKNRLFKMPAGQYYQSKKD